MRSRPANASLSCVPIDASWMTGIVISAVNDRYMTRSPIVIVPFRIELPPISIIAMPVAPMTSDENAVIGRDAGQRLRDVAEQPVRALREDELFALLGRVGLDDADAAERFGEPAGDLGVDLAALAEQRPQPLERGRHAAAERAEDHDRDERQLPVEVEQDAQRDRRRSGSSRSAARGRCRRDSGCLRRRS